MSFQSPWPGWGAWGAGGALAALLCAAPCRAFTDLQRGDDAPAITLPAAGGGVFDTGRAREGTLLILFGETSQERTSLACRQIIAALEAPRLAGEPVEWVLILARGGRAEDVPADISSAPHPPAIVVDENRAAFGAYQVKVVPTVVLIDRKGAVVYAMAGYTNRFGDIIYDALSFAAGKLSLQRFEQTLAPPDTVSADDRRLRAARLVQFAGQLARRGLEEMAQAKYLESLELDPDSVAARLGLGDLLVRQGRYEQARERFSQVLAADPDSAEAALGMAWVEAFGDTPRLPEAAGRVEQLIRRRPDWPRAHYLMGLIQERRGETAESLASFKRAAELLLYMGPQATPPAPEGP